MLAQPPVSIGDTLTQRIIGLAIEVHRALGPGLLESVYEECLCAELKEANLAFDRQVALPVSYKGRPLECGYRMDLVVERAAIIEIKAVEQLVPVHQAQLLTYMKLSGIPTGLLLNFHTAYLRDGIRRMSLSRAAQT
jgi:GxxExxY protein